MFRRDREVLGLCLSLGRHTGDTGYPGGRWVLTPLYGYYLPPCAGCGSLAPPSTSGSSLPGISRQQGHLVPQDSWRHILAAQLACACTE